MLEKILSTIILIISVGLWVASIVNIAMLPSVIQGLALN